MKTVPSIPADRQLLTLSQLLEVYAEIDDLMRDVAERLELAGSGRRGKREGIKDLETCAIPKCVDRQSDLFGDDPDQTDKDNLFYARLKELLKAGRIQLRTKSDGSTTFGERTAYLWFLPTRSTAIPEPFWVAWDTFSVLPPAQWGIKFLLATGPAEFNIRIAKQRHQGGRILKIGQRIEDGALWDRKQMIVTPEEKDVFDAIGLRFIHPEDRR